MAEAIRWDVKEFEGGLNEGNSWLGPRAVKTIVRLRS
jgi:hypothetical protein